MCLLLVPLHYDYDMTLKNMKIIIVTKIYLPQTKCNFAFLLCLNLYRRQQIMCSPCLRKTAKMSCGGWSSSMSSSLFSQQRSSSQGGALTRQPERGGKECPKLLIIGLRAPLSLLGQLGVIVHCFRGSKAGIMQCDILLKILAINFFCYRWQPICSRPGPT